MYLKLEIINSRNDSRKFWSLMNSLMPERIKSASPKYLNVNNCQISDSAEIAEHINKYFCDIDKALADKVDSVNSYDHCSYLSDPTSSSMFFRPTFDNEIINIINQLDSRKSCGSDGISAKFVILAACVITPYLSILCNGCLSFGLFSSCLKTAKVSIIPIFKSGDKSNLLNYRFISLLPIFSRTVEKIVFSRTINYLNAFSILTPTQYGFRSNYSTTHAVLDIVSTSNQKIILLLFCLI